MTLGEKYSDEMNSLYIEWEAVDGPASYNIYRNGKSLTNSKNTKYHDKDLDFGEEYTYEISSLSDDGLRVHCQSLKRKVRQKYLKLMVN